MKNASTIQEPSSMIFIGEQQSFETSNQGGGGGGNVAF